MAVDVKLDDLYREVILDHYRDPRHHEPVKDPDVEELGYNPLCGDEITVQIKCDKKNCIYRIGVFGKGCSICMASGSILSELINGKPIKNATELVKTMKDLMHGRTVKDLEALGDLEALEGVKKFPVRIKCALLPWTTLESAVSKVKEKK